MLFLFSQAELWTVIANWFMVGATIILGIIAIYGDRFRSWLLPPKLTLELVSDEGYIVDFQKPRRYYLLRVKNSNPRSPANNCQVLLCGFHQRVADEFIREEVTIPLNFVWAPKEIRPFERKVIDEEVFSIGFVEKPDMNGIAEFKPEFCVTPCGHDYSTSARHASRYLVRIRADNYFSKQVYAFEIELDGTWTDDPKKMKKHFNIRQFALNKVE
ncbi:MAG: hypothetical protein JXB10_16460 [Pirellulales bacterium]|nr:hypothetical protein [Pirellulales bacterium]